MDLKQANDALELAVKSIEEKEAQIAELEQKQTEAAEANTKTAAEVEELKEQIADIEAKGHYTMAQNEKAFDLNVEVKGLLKSAQPNENILVKGLTTEAGSAGETIQTQYAPEIIKPLKERSAFLSRIGQRVVSSPDQKRFVKTGASQTRWAGENTANAALGNTGTHGYATVTGTFGKVEAYPFVTGESLEDSAYNVMADLAEDVTNEIADAVAEAALNGDGTNKPLGMLQRVATGNGYDEFEEIVADNDVDALRTAAHSLKSGYRGNAAWLMSETDFLEIQALKDADGRSFVQYEITDAATPRLFGFPILIEHGLPAGTRLFGDFARAFELLVIRDLEVMANPYVVPGNIQVYHAMRVGTMVKDVKAVKIIKNA